MLPVGSVRFVSGKIDIFERVSNVWMKLTRGDIAGRFDDIRKSYLDVTRSTKDQIEREAEILDAYFAAFPNVRSYMEGTVREARQRGYTETLFGRRRQIPELASGNFRIRQAGERQAMNAGIQGLAADIFKVALVRLDARLREEGLQAGIVLQIHDELLRWVNDEL